MNKKLKILFSVNGFPAKSETFIVNHIVAALDAGMEVVILANHKQSLQETTQQDILLKYQLLDKVVVKKGMPKNKLVRVFTALSLAFTSLKAFKFFTILLNPFKFGFSNFNMNAYYELYPLLNLNTFDVYHAHFGQNAIGIALAKELGVIHSKLITTFHGYDAASEDVKSKRNLIMSYKYVFKHSNTITVNTPYLKEVLNDLGFSGSIILPMSINTDFFKPDASYNKNLKSKTIHLISIGRLMAFKCHYLGIEAVKNLIEKGYNIKYHIVGTGPEYNNLTNIIKNYQLDDNIILEKNKSQEEIKELLLNSDIFLMTSNYDNYGRRETQGVVTIEAQACGIPVVAFASGGVPYTLINNKTGFLVDEMDIETYTNKLEELLNDWALRKEFGKNARQFVLDYYSNNACNKQLLEIYNN
ncbi:glycosyltransferase [Yeosuana marina]|uniref:glycosyltransferase n=1 Tax=Yeosuana marina TaxID=1565536 RepID=UPI001420AD80|nr:glycosyltransferase [Yeosuana marina]